MDAVRAAHPFAGRLQACWSSPIQSNDVRVLGTFAFYYRDKRGPDDMHRRMVDVGLHLCALALEREEARAHIHRLAFFDTLTGLFNRAMLRGGAEHARGKVDRASMPLAVLFIDLDRFKLVNDTQGHAAGDNCCGRSRGGWWPRCAATIWWAALRAMEFVAVLPHCAAEQAALTAERLLAERGRPRGAGRHRR